MSVYISKQFSSPEEFEAWVVAQGHSNKDFLDQLCEKDKENWDKKACKMTVKDGKLQLLCEDGNVLAETNYYQPDGDTVCCDGKDGKLSIKGIQNANDPNGKKFRVWVGTQAEYNAIRVKDPRTMYYITDENVLDDILSGVIKVGHAKNADKATSADHAASATEAKRAGSAGSATNAQNAINAQNAESATNAKNAESATNAKNADKATSAENDSEGNKISESYLKRWGGIMTGKLYFWNNQALSEFGEKENPDFFLGVGAFEEIDESGLAGGRQVKAQKPENVTVGKATKLTDDWKNEGSWFAENEKTVSWEDFKGTYIVKLESIVGQYAYTCVISPDSRSGVGRSNIISCHTDNNSGNRLVWLECSLNANTNTINLSLKSVDDNPDTGFNLKVYWKKII